MESRKFLILINDLRSCPGCPGNENTEAELSRGENLTSLKDIELWLFGSQWLRKCGNHWLKSNADAVEETDLENKEYEWYVRS